MARLIVSAVAYQKIATIAEVLISVSEAETGKPVKNLNAAHFAIWEHDHQREIGEFDPAPNQPGFYRLILIATTPPQIQALPVLEEGDVYPLTVIVTRKPSQGLLSLWTDNGQVVAPLYVNG